MEKTPLEKHYENIEILKIEKEKKMKAMEKIVELQSWIDRNNEAYRIAKKENLYNFDVMDYIDRKRENLDRNWLKSLIEVVDTITYYRWSDKTPFWEIDN